MQEVDVFCVCICSVGQQRCRWHKSLVPMPFSETGFYVASQQFQRFRGFITYLYLVLCVIRRFIFDRSEKEISLLDFYTWQHSTADSRMKPALLSQYSYNILHQFIRILLFFADTIPRRKISFAPSKQTSQQSTRNTFFVTKNWSISDLNQNMLPFAVNRAAWRSFDFAAGLLLTYNGFALKRLESHRFVQTLLPSGSITKRICWPLHFMRPPY